MQGYQNFKAIKQGLLAHVAELPQARQSAPAAHQESVQTIQSAVLLPHQVDALCKIGDAIATIGELERLINQLLTLNSIPVKPVFLADTGRLYHDLADTCDRSKSAQARLERGLLDKPPALELAPSASSRAA